MQGLEAELALLTKAVQSAGKIALRHWRKSPKFWEKPDGLGPVTEADLAVNEALSEQLRGARPDYGWLSEESVDDEARLSAKRVFIVDPIDGTRSFMAGEDTFAIVAGIAEGSRMIAGAVWLPALGRLYSAHAHGPALYNGVEIHASRTEVPEGATMLTNAAGLAAKWWPGGVPAVRRAFRPSLAYRMCLVAEGRHDSMVVFRDTFEWDIASASLIAERAGVVVSDGQGKPLLFNQREPHVAGVLAAPAVLHAGLMSRISPGS